MVMYGRSYTVKLILALLFVLVVSPVSAQMQPADRKPLSKAQVQELVAAGMTSEKLAKAVEQRGIDFVPTDDFLDALRDGGAEAVLLKALAAAKPKPLSKNEVLRLLATGTPSRQVATIVEQRGIDFDLSDENLDTLQVAGADDSVLKALRGTERANLKAVEPQSGEKHTEAHQPQDFGTGIHSVSGDVAPPLPIYKPAPPYTREARKAKVKGTVVLWIVVDAQGNVSDAREVSQRLGKGLDEKAVETVRTWKFKPATRNGVPVPVRVMVGVSFKLFEPAPAKE